MNVEPENGRAYLVETTGVEKQPGCRCPVCNEGPGPSSLDC